MKAEPIFITDAVARLCLFGASPDTPNMGVSALFASAVAALHRSLPEAQFTVFDYALGHRAAIAEVGQGLALPIQLRGARNGKRYHRPENLATMAVAATLGPLGSLINPNIRAIDEAAAVLDVSGGDSFSDIYGRERFISITRPKLMAIRRGTPLILLPQTYGPYHDPKLKAIAAKAVRGAAMCWARDERSFSILQDLLGDSFDPDRHRCGVDLAFGLEPRDASESLSGKIRSMIEADRSARPLVGFNVSGLIYNDPAKAVSRYKFKADYRELLESFLSWLLESTDANLVLIPHVMSEPGHYESDTGACEAVAKALGAKHADRVVVSPRTLDQCQVKWLIGQTDWFCGTRMHSTIASLSSGVPTATVSYSDKAKGVFETCGQGEHVVDPRELETPEVVERLKASFGSRPLAKASLSEHLPAVKAKADEQMGAVAECIRTVSTRAGKQAKG
ncbi:MAG: polysaccharide pyruvyl transferase family protein [Phycisphaerales bacterium JB050]